jgi:hypothetical protein
MTARNPLGLPAALAATIVNGDGAFVLFGACTPL